MLGKFQNKYTIKSARLEGYDYSQDGMYFVTICTKDRDHFFGYVEKEIMNLFEIGKIANKYWQEIPHHFPFVNLDEYIIMPNHIHVIIEICKNETEIETHLHCIRRDEAMPGGGRDEAMPGGGRDEAMPRLYNEYNKYNGKYPKMSEISPKSGSLSVIIGSFKSIVSKMVNQQYPNIIFDWQSRFYDHIIPAYRQAGATRNHYEKLENILLIIRICGNGTEIIRKARICKKCRSVVSKNNFKSLSRSKKLITIKLSTIQIAFKRAICCI